MTDTLRTVADNLVDTAKDIEDQATHSAHFACSNTLRLVARSIYDAIKEEKRDCQTEIERLQGWLDRFVEVGDGLYNDLEQGLRRRETMLTWLNLKRSYDIYK